jgi:iron complex transport system ATP-binding protein
VVAEGAPADVLTPAALRIHYGARAEVVAGRHGPAVLPVRATD